MTNKRVVVIGGGFGGFSAVKALGNKKGIQVTLIDRKNHHLFQPLLYQVAMAGLNPSEISIPLRSYFSGYKNVHILMAEVHHIDLENKKVSFDKQYLDYDYLLIACGAKHFYFGNNEWEEHAPGLKLLNRPLKSAEEFFSRLSWLKKKKMRRKGSLI